MSQDGNGRRYLERGRKVERGQGGRISGISFFKCFLRKLQDCNCNKYNNNSNNFDNSNDDNNKSNCSNSNPAIFMIMLLGQHASPCLTREMRSSAIPATSIAAASCCYRW